MFSVSVCPMFMSISAFHKQFTCAYSLRSTSVSRFNTSSRSSLQSWSSLSSYKSMWIYIKNVIAQEYLPIWRMSYCDTYHTLYRWIKLPNKKRETLLNITLILCPETFDHDSPFLSVFIDILCWRDLVFTGLGSSINKCISVMFYVHSITAW